MKKRADKVFDKVGESFLINGTAAAKGIFMLLDKNPMHVFFDDIEQDMFDRPALIALVPADTDMAVNDTVARDARTYTVQKVARRRYGDEVVSQFVLLT
jgi:hypothetical protein